jgi:hypothetical protein
MSWSVYGVRPYARGRAALVTAPLSSWATVQPVSGSQVAETEGPDDLGDAV